MEITNIKMNYSGLFKLLEENDLNRNALVKRAGLTHNAILSIKNGEPIAMTALLKICVFFHCDISEVVKIDFDAEDNMRYMFELMAEYLEDCSNERILLHEGDKSCVFWIADKYGYPAYVLMEVNLDLANRVSGPPGIRDLAQDMVQRAVQTAEKFNMDDPVLNDPPEKTHNNAINIKDGTWYNCHGIIVSDDAELDEIDKNLWYQG